SSPSNPLRRAGSRREKSPSAAALRASSRRRSAAGSSSPCSSSPRLRERPSSAARVPAIDPPWVVVAETRHVRTALGRYPVSRTIKRTAGLLSAGGFGGNVRRGATSAAVAELVEAALGLGGALAVAGGGVLGARETGLGGVGGLRVLDGLLLVTARLLGV